MRHFLKKRHWLSDIFTGMCSCTDWSSAHSQAWIFKFLSLAGKYRVKNECAIEQHQQPRVLWYAPWWFWPSEDSEDQERVVPLLYIVLSVPVIVNT